MGHIVVTDKTVTVYGFDNLDQLDLHIGKRGLVVKNVTMTTGPLRVCNDEPCTCRIEPKDPHWAPGPGQELVGPVDTSHWLPSPSPRIDELLSRARLRLDAPPPTDIVDRDKQ